MVKETEERSTKLQVPPVRIGKDDLSTNIREGRKKEATALQMLIWFKGFSNVFAPASLLIIEEQPHLHSFAFI